MAARRRILVLGASGYLGSHLVRRASASHDLEVVALESGRPRDHAPSAPTAVEWRAADLERGEDELVGLLADVGPDVVLSAAALARLAACEADPARAGRLNALLPERLGRWCGPRGVRLVHVSTDLVFGAHAPPPEGFSEAERPAPLSVYGRTKAEGDERLLAACHAALVVRLPLLFGDSGGTGAGASDSLLADVAAGRRARLFRDEWRTPLDVADAAAALLELARGDRRGVLHVAGPRRLSRVELGRLVLLASGRSEDEAAAWIEDTTRAAAGMDADRPGDCSLDARRAAAALRTPLRSPEDALAAPA